MKGKYIRRIVVVVLVVAVLAGIGVAANAASGQNTSRPAAAKVYSNQKAKVDATNLENGTLAVTYTGKRTFGTRFGSLRRGEPRIRMT